MDCKKTLLDVRLELQTWFENSQAILPRNTFKYSVITSKIYFYAISLYQLREYELSEVFHRSSDDRRYDVLQLDKLNHNSIDVLDGNRALSIAEEVERNEAPRIYSEGSLTTPDSAYSYYSL